MRDVIYVHNKSSKIALLTSNLPWYAQSIPVEHKELFLSMLIGQGCRDVALENLHQMM
jgi:hypothetical protein